MKTNYQKKSNKQLCLIFAFFLATSSFAQTKELSVGSGVLFNSYTGNIMYKKYKPDLKSAIRISLSVFDLSFSTNEPFKKEVDNLNAISNDLKKNKDYSFGIGLNIGKQNNISKIDKFQIYRGYEFGFYGYNSIDNNTEGINYSFDNDKINVINAAKRTFKKNSINLSNNQIIGLKYEVLPNLSFSLETMISFNISRYSSSEIYKYYSITNITSEVKKSSNNYDPSIFYKFQVIPSAKLWVTYLFKK